MKFYRVCHESVIAIPDLYHTGPYMAINNLGWDSDGYRVCDSLGWAHCDDSHPSVREEFGQTHSSTWCPHEPLVSVVPASVRRRSGLGHITLSYRRDRRRQASNPSSALGHRSRGPDPACSLGSFGPGAVIGP